MKLLTNDGLKRIEDAHENDVEGYMSSEDAAVLFYHARELMRIVEQEVRPSEVNFTAVGDVETIVKEYEKNGFELVSAVPVLPVGAVTAFVLTHFRKP